MTNAYFALVLIAALGSALVAGIFYAFSTFVMTALGRLAPSQGIAAMQSINIVVINPWFLAAFFGTAAACIVLLALAAIGWSGARDAWLLGGCLLYLLGCIAVTMALNVPLNNELAKVDPDSTQGTETWQRYLSAWTFWNHVRTAASIAAAAAFIAALR